MLVSNVFYAIMMALIILLSTGLVWLFLKKSEHLQTKWKLFTGFFVGILAAGALHYQRTSLILVKEDGEGFYSLIGEKDYTLSNGEIIHLSAVDHGDLVVNDSPDSLVIERSEYEGAVTEGDLSGTLVLIAPQQVYIFHGERIEYLFEESPDFIETEKSASENELTKFTLRKLKASDFDAFYIYEGPTKWGKPHGNGRFWVNRDRLYIGDVIEGNFKGKGEIIYEDGGRYVGDFDYDYKHGHGVYYYPDSSRYEGEWKDDEKSGTGTYYYNDGDIYSGNFKNGMMNGSGKYTFNNGDYYEGEFVDDYFEGEGTYYYSSSGRSETGIWSKDELVDESVSDIILR